MTTNATLQSLAEKLNALDLTDSETELLLHFMTSGLDEAEVSGFGDEPRVAVRGVPIGMPTQIFGTAPGRGIFGTAPGKGIFGTAPGKG